VEQLFMATATIVIGVFGCVGYFFASNVVLDSLYPPRGPNAGRNILRAGMIRPWLFLMPAMLLLGVYLVYPVFVSIWLSFHDSAGTRFVGTDNYTWLLADGKFRESLYNNFLWVLVVPAMSTFFGLIAAAADRPAPLGQHRQVADLHADGDQLRRRLADLEVRLRQQRGDIGLINAIAVAFGASAGRPV
jgi:hypothetical protein